LAVLIFIFVWQNQFRLPLELGPSMQPRWLKMIRFASLW
jgi:hypothetical protein